MKTQLLLALSILSALSFAHADEAKTLVIDKEHSEISFSAAAVFDSDGKSGYSVKGAFADYDGKILFSSQNFTDSKVQFKVSIDSLHTHATTVSHVGSFIKDTIVDQFAAADSKRDEHLKSPDFFDAKNFPDATFRSLSITPTQNNEYIMRGKLTMHGISQTVEMGLKPVKQYQDSKGIKHSVFEAKANNLSRASFGVGVDMLHTVVLGNLGIAIKDDVTLDALLDVVEVSQ